MSLSHVLKQGNVSTGPMDMKNHAKINELEEFVAVCCFLFVSNLAPVMGRIYNSLPNFAAQPSMIAP